MLTPVGTALFSTLFALVFTISFRITVNVLGLRSIENDSERKMGYMLTSLISIACATLPLLIISIILESRVDTADNYRTIYSNKIEATVAFETSQDQTNFVGGKQLKNVTSYHSGVLTMSKGEVDVKKEIDYAEYLGDVEKGSIVEKIEYSNSTKESKFFGVTLMTEKSDRLKIHLKKRASEIAKEKKNAEIKKELKSLIESSK